MKKVKLLLLVLFLSNMTFAQTSDAEVDAMVGLLGVQKKEAVAKLVSVSGKDSAAFWKIYDEYLAGNKITGANRIKLYEKTAYSYSDMTPERADSLATHYFSNRMEQEKNLELYYNKIKTVTNANVAFQFYQAEVYLLTLIRSQIMLQIPTYGEFQNSVKKK